MADRGWYAPFATKRCVCAPSQQVRSCSAGHRDPRAPAAPERGLPWRRQRQFPTSPSVKLRGQRSAGEFAAAVRRAAREIGEQVACDARYIGRVESGEIRCPNYAYERVFLHMFPGSS